MDLHDTHKAEFEAYIELLYEEDMQDFANGCTCSVRIPMMSNAGSPSMEMGWYRMIDDAYCTVHGELCSAIKLSTQRFP